MELNNYFKSVVDQDRTPIVICDINHVIIYMNPQAVKNYSNRGGIALLGKSLLECHHPQSAFKIMEIIHWFNESKNNNIIHTFYDEQKNKDVYMVALRDNDGNLIGYFEKHEFRINDDMPFYAF